MFVRNGGQASFSPRSACVPTSPLGSRSCRRCRCSEGTMEGCQCPPRSLFRGSPAEPGAGTMSIRSPGRLPPRSPLRRNRLGWGMCFWWSFQPRRQACMVPGIATHPCNSQSVPACMSSSWLWCRLAIPAAARAVRPPLSCRALSPTVPPPVLFPAVCSRCFPLYRVRPHCWHLFEL